MRGCTPSIHTGPCGDHSSSRSTGRYYIETIDGRGLLLWCSDCCYGDCCYCDCCFGDCCYSDGDCCYGDGDCLYGNSFYGNDGGDCCYGAVVMVVVMAIAVMLLLL